MDVIVELGKEPGIVYLQIDKDTGRDIFEAIVDEKRNVIAYLDGMIFLDLPRWYESCNERSNAYMQLCTSLSKDANHFKLDFKKAALCNVNGNLADIFAKAGMSVEKSVPECLQLYRLE